MCNVSRRRITICTITCACLSVLLCVLVWVSFSLLCVCGCVRVCQYVCVLVYQYFCVCRCGVCVWVCDGVDDAQVVLSQGKAQKCGTFICKMGLKLFYLSTLFLLCGKFSCRQSILIFIFLFFVALGCCTAVRCKGRCWFKYRV